MLKYNQFCGEILEKVTDVKWLQKTFQHCLDSNLPITPKIAKAMYDMKKTVFHITDPLRIINLKKLVGSKKSISSFTMMYDYRIRNMAGVQTMGGLLLQIEGNLMISSDNDIMSMPDEQGRRWLAGEWLHGNSDFFDGLNDICNELLQNITRPKTGVWHDDKQMKRNFISEYIKRAEEYTIKNIKDLKNLIESQSGSSWDEILVNEIKIKDVLLLDLNQSYLTNEIIKVYGSLENCYNILKSIVGGEIYITNDRSDAIKFVQDRGGRVT